MRKLFKKAILGVSALALPLALTATVNAEGPSDAETIDTTLEYQLNTSANSMRFISTMELNGKSLDDITSIDMNFRLTKDDQVKDSIPQSTTTVYESISGENGKEKIDGTYYAVFTITNIDSKVGWRITPTFTYNFADGSETDVIASSWLIGGKRQYFVQQYTDWGTDLYYYLYGADGNNIWPGERMNLVDADNHIYYFDYMESSNYTNVVFNSGSDVHKTNDMPLSSTYNYYVQQGGDAYAHPTAGHDGVSGHDENKHWSCSTCKYDAEPHNLSGSTTGTTRTITCSECGYSASFDTTVIYLTRNWDDWTNLHVHCWYNDGNSDIALDTWPGTAMTLDHTNEQGQEVYRVTIPSNTQYIKFNNGDNGKETVAIRLSDYENYNAFYFEWRDNQNQVNCYLYIPE